MVGAGEGVGDGVGVGVLVMVGVGEGVCDGVGVGLVSPSAFAALSLPPVRTFPDNEAILSQVFRIVLLI